MTGDALLATLPCAALGLALARTPWRETFAPIGTCALAAIVGNLLLGSSLPPKGLVVGCGLTAALTLIPVYLPRAQHPLLLLAIAGNAGLWSGALAAGSLGVMGLVAALPWIALRAPAGWLVRRQWQIALKVVASWMVAIALLAATLNSVSMPSYELDHME